MSAKKICLRGGEVVDPNKTHSGAFDIVVADGVIADFTRRGEAMGDDYEIIDCRGLWVCPGLIDIHVHLREPGAEWKETVASGSRAALLSGITAVCQMPNTNPVADSPEVIGYILDKARSSDYARVYPIGSVSLGMEGKVLSPLFELKGAGCIAISDDGRPVANAGLMRRALEIRREIELPVFGHEEDMSISQGGSMNESPLSLRLGLPGMHAVSEEVCIARDIELARVTGGHAHFCHVSTWRAVQLIERAKSDGINVTGEATPHHLWLTEDAVAEYDTAAKMSPPLRRQRDVDAVRKGLKDGVLDCIATDHAPHDYDTKRCEFERASFGIIGFETLVPLSLQLVHDGILSKERWVEVVQQSPARLIRKQDTFGFVKGAKADIIAIHPTERWELTKENIKSKSKNTCLLGKELAGKVKHVVLDGVVRVNDERECYER